MIKADFIVPSHPKDKGGPLEKPKIIGVTGPTGAGKSTLLLNLLNHLSTLHEFDQALFVTANMRDNLLDHIEMPVTSSPADLETWMNKVKQPTEEPQYNLLILDDLQGSPDFKQMSTRSDFLKFVISHRHFGKVAKNGKEKGGTYVIFTAQRLKNSFSPTIKDNVNIWFAYPPRNIEEEKEIHRLGDDKVRTKRALDLVKLEDRQFLYINKDSRPSQYFAGFQKELNTD